MVEFPLVDSGNRVLRRRKKFYPGNPPPADIKVVSPNGVSGLAGMWETNTFKASFYARLNVALRREFRLKSG
jgi:hypothetical protein